MAVSPSSSEDRLYTGQKMPSNLDVVATAHYESGPPASKLVGSVDDADIFETVKEEAWEEKKVKTTKKTKNIERRIQRQVVLEDGRVKEDSGPIITEDATEDTVTNEVTSNENQRPEGQAPALEAPPGEGWVAVPGSLQISEKCTKTVNSHEEVEDELETEEVQFCGDVTNQEAEDHVLGKSDLRSLVAHRQSHGLEIALPQKRVVHEATRRRGHIDTVDVKETSKIQDGRVVTETERTVQKEEYDNESAPDSGSSISDGSVHETKKETSHNLVHTKDEDLLEYYAVPKGGTLAQGVKIGEGMHIVSEDVHEDKQGGDVESLNERYKREGRPRNFKRDGFKERTDALTRKPLDYQEEERTRKTETNRWLEHHFGSESGRSGTSSLDDDGRHSAGGNRITITMSPRPATPEDVVDNIVTSSVRRSYDTAPNSFIKKIPPIPPPKPERIYSSSSSPTSPPPYQPRDIQESELTAARARLRSTGVRLIDENKENYPTDSPPSSPFDHQRPFNGNSKYLSSVNVTSYNKDPVYSSRFSSGKPETKTYAPEIHRNTIERRNMERKNTIEQKNTIERRDSFEPKSPPRKKSPSPPPVKVSTSPPTPLTSTTNVGRSHSFQISTLPWFSKKKSESKYKSNLKDYKSEEKLDNIDKKSFGTARRKLFERFSQLTHKDRTPSPPPRQPRRNDSVQREAATQTSPSPVPPPRMKKKRRPRSSYFFGQEDNKVNSDSFRSYNSTTMLNGYDDSSSYSNYERNIRNSRQKTSPKIERRYRTTKTYTPVITIPSESSSNHYRDSSVPKSSWTNTVDPRRRPRTHFEDDKTTASTLPRKLHSTNSYPRKQYFFGENDSSSESYSSRNRSYNKNNSSYSDYRSERRQPTTYNTLPIDRSPKQVGRSQSFNVQAGKTSSYSNHKEHQPLTNIYNQKSSSTYRSSPYLNLRSPNLIASIARTPSMNKANSVDNLDSPYKTERDDKKNRFMEGLLNDAPELFNFLHGDESKKHNNNNNEIPKGITHSQMPVSGKHFTFGKRASSPGRQENQYTNGNLSPHSVNRRTAFNLKTSGKSMLYSPAFRERINSEERNSFNGRDDYRDYSSRPLMSK